MTNNNWLRKILKLASCISKSFILFSFHKISQNYVFFHYSSSPKLNSFSPKRSPQNYTSESKKNHQRFRRKYDDNSDGSDGRRNGRVKVSSHRDQNTLVELHLNKVDVSNVCRWQQPLFSQILFENGLDVYVRLGVCLLPDHYLLFLSIIDFNVPHYDSMQFFVFQF